MSYGFLIPDNEANTINIDVPLIEADECFEIKKNISKKDRQKFLCVKTLQDNNMIKFLSWVRYVVFNEEEDILDRQSINLEKVVTSTNLKPLTIINEVKVWKFIKLLVSKSLAGYSNSYEDDVKILKEDETSKNLSHNER